jgi:2-haloacid dehalogenase
LRLRLDLGDEAASALMNQYLRLDAFAENLAVLEVLHRRRVRAGILSNGDAEMLRP